MTTDEFHAHIMAALHGPKAAEIVARIVEIVETEPSIAGPLGYKLGAVIAGHSSQHHALVNHLAMLAHLSALDPWSKRDPNTLSIAAGVNRAKDRAVVQIRAVLREMMGSSESGRQVAAGIYLDIPERD